MASAATLDPAFMALSPRPTSFLRASLSILSSECCPSWWEVREERLGRERLFLRHSDVAGSVPITFAPPSARVAGPFAFTAGCAGTIWVSLRRTCPRNPGLTNSLEADLTRVGGSSRLECGMHGTLDA